MEPLTLWERIVNLLWAPWIWLQCDAMDENCYCVRRKGHFGTHRTYSCKVFTE